MSLKYLLDTNVVSEPLRPIPNERVLAKLKRHQDLLAIPSLVWHELLFGCYRLPASAKRKTIESYLYQVVAATIPILSYDEKAATWHAAERARLSVAGKTPTFVDGQIAAVAAVNDLVLVTFNVADYRHFTNLSVQNWQA